MNNTASVIIDICVLVFASIGFFTTVGILCLIVYHRQRSRINTSTVLMCNTYVCIIWILLILFDMYGHNLYGDLHSNTSFDSWWCYGRAYLLHVGTSLLYYSYLLQAVFRFFRIVLSNHRQLQSSRLIFLLVLFQWLISFLAVIPITVLRHFQYVPLYFYCEILLSDNQGLLIGGLLSYQLPMVGIGLIYVYILYYMKKSKRHLIVQNRLGANQRDLSVLRRILILIGLLVTLALPTSALWMNFLVTGYVIPIGYHVGWSTFTLSLSILPGLSVFLTPQLRELFTVPWHRNRRIEPTIIVRQRKIKETLTQQ